MIWCALRLTDGGGSLYRGKGKPVCVMNSFLYSLSESTREWWPRPASPGGFMVADKII